MVSSSELIVIGDEVMADMLKLVNSNDDDELWKVLWTEDEISLHTRKGDQQCHVDIIRCRTILKNTDLATVKALVSPWLPYRVQWDDIMQRCDLLQELENGYRLIHHVTKKKLPLSARDSVDIVSTKYESNRILMAARSVPTAGPRPTSDLVRTYQHLGGYCFWSTDENSVVFTMYFQCDLNVALPSFVQKLIDKAKPKFMYDKMKSLRKALNTIEIHPAHLEKF
ncbi:START domain protein [Dictyocaulus viviparus]|uniref:START domain protein n=1 Tax=Dictyocaulus viviparus TaxID=29172 RepID=A0A0D8XQ36_DICVI|nr:START domain protein [Dictyocaulus viviparus]